MRKNAKNTLRQSRIFPPEDIVYVDESGIDECYSREYGLATRGEKVYGEVNGKHYKRLNIVAGQCGTQKIAPYIYSWNTTGDWFEVWFEWWLCPLLSAGKVIVMDNATIHRKTKLENIAKFYGLRIVWLPPYSPEFNPIEHLWANLKKWLRSYAALFNSIQDALSLYFQVG